jgi:hypothetical protein
MSQPEISKPAVEMVIGAATVTAVPAACGPARNNCALSTRKFAASNSTVDVAAVHVMAARLVPCPTPQRVTSVLVPRFDQASAAVMFSV